MTFDAGTVSGGLKFDLSEYTRSMIDAESLMQAFPAIVLEFLEDPMLAAVEVFKEAADAFVETIGEVGRHAQEIGLDAEKAGTTVKWFDDMAAAARTVNVSADQLSVGLKFLQRNAEDAAQGQKEATEAFEQIGLSIDFVRSHLDDTQGLFDAVHDRISQLPAAAERTAASMAIMGRSGSDLLPVFAMQKSSMEQIIDEHRKLGAEEDEASARTGQQWATISGIISDAWEGIKRKLAEPILDYLSEHMTEIIKIANGFAGTVGDLIPLALDAMKVAIELALPAVDLLAAALDLFLEEQKLVFEAAGALGSTYAQNIADSMQKAQDSFYTGMVSLNELAFGGGEGGASKPTSAPTIAPVDSSWATPVGTALHSFGNDAMESGGLGGGPDSGLSGGGVYQSVLSDASPAFYTSLADAFRPLLFEVANSIEAAIAAAGTTSAVGSDGAKPPQLPPSSSGSSGNVAIQNINVAGLDATATADKIAQKIAPHVRQAFEQQQRAADAAARHSKVQEAVTGQ